MQINLHGKNLELTEEIKEYVSKRITNLEKFLAGMEKSKGETVVDFEVARTTNHHKSGDVFKADGKVNINGEEFFASAEADELYTAVDDVKETLYHDIRKNKERRQTLFKRGASSVKKMMKGLSKRNPFTSKY